MQNESSVTRRTFLRHLTVLSAAVTAIPLLDSASRADSPPADFVSAGKVTDFTPDEFKRVALDDGRVIYVKRTVPKPDVTPKADAVPKPDEFLVLSARCTHKGCECLWVAKEAQFQCPCHGGAFDDKGAVVAGPPRTALKSLTSKVDQGLLMVEA